MTDIKTSWQVIVDPPLSGKENMRKDIQLFRDFEAGLIPPTLRIYSWERPCVSVGYSQKPELEPELEIVRRPTGGGIVFHNTAEVTYSLVMDKNDPMLPKGLIPAYKVISEAIVFALKKIGVEAELVKRTSGNQEIRDWGIRGSGYQVKELCFSYPAEYEVVCRGKKIVGSAQKRGRKALLQQGSIFVRNDQQNMIPLAISVEEVLKRRISFKEMADALIEGFVEKFKFQISN